MSEERDQNSVNNEVKSDSSRSSEPTTKIEIREVLNTESKSDGKGSGEFSEAWAPAASARDVKVRMDANADASNGSERKGPPPPAGANTAGKEGTRESTD